MKETKLFEHATGTETKLWLSWNMLPNINTCENGWSNFLANLIVLSLKLLEITHFAWPNLSVYFNFLCAVPRDDVIESTHFLMRPPVIIPPWIQPYMYIKTVHYFQQHFCHIPHWSIISYAFPNSPKIHLSHLLDTFHTLDLHQRVDPCTLCCAKTYIVPPLLHIRFQLL